MPHLTTPRGAAAPAPRAGEVPLGLGAPGYAHPLLAPAEWAELTRPGTPVHWAVLDVADGPGARPDPHCSQAAVRLRTAGAQARPAGPRLLGRLAMRDGARPFAELVADARRFREWYGTGGFYLAGAPAGRAELPAVRRVVEALRGLGEGLRIVLGHGTHPYAGYADTADQLVTFHGSWEAYRWSQVAEWTADHPADRFCHLVHGLPRTHVEEAVRIARWQGAGTVWFTDRRASGGRDPWASMPGYWDEIVSRVGTGVLE